MASAPEPFPLCCAEKLKKHALSRHYDNARQTCAASVMWASLRQFLSEQSSKRPDERRWTNPTETAGFYAVMLNATRLASRMDYPLNPDDFKTANKGQVKDQRGRVPNEILTNWKLPYRFGTESGGTNRASIGHVDRYVAFLNQVHRGAGSVNHLAAMVFWLKKTRQFFQASPIQLSFEPKQTVRVFIDRVIAQVKERERNVAGTKLLGLFMQHIVGAKLDIVLGAGKVHHHPATQADVQYERSGDFEINNMVLHVTSSPTERLVEKCIKNLNDHKRPVIVTLTSKVEALAA